MTTFQDFWSLYPRKVSKRAALKAWEKEMKLGTDPDAIIQGLKRQLPIMARKDEQFIPHASTWLHGGRFEDEVYAPISMPAAPKPGDMADFLMGMQEKTNVRTIDAEYVERRGSGTPSHAHASLAIARRH